MGGHRPALGGTGLLLCVLCVGADGLCCSSALIVPSADCSCSRAPQTAGQ